MNQRLTTLVFLCLTMLALSGCKRTPASEGSTESESQDTPAVNVADDKPTQDEQAVEPAIADDEASPAIQLKVNTKTSRVDFLMTAPVENIHGIAKGATHGTLAIDPSNIGHTHGEIRIDLDKLVLLQATVDEETGAFKKEIKNAKQNEHMKTWFQISSDAPKAMREKNRWIKFNIKSITSPSVNDVTSVEGDVRKVKAKVNGDFTLHGRTVKKTAYVEATFKYSGDELQSVSIRSLRPVLVNLKRHDIQPRSAFDKLAQKTLSALGQKVAEAAPVKLDFTLVP